MSSTGRHSSSNIQTNLANLLFSVNGYQEILWAEINVEEINNELIEFGNRCLLKDFTILQRDFYPPPGAENFQRR